jgi:hypothetical protein
MGIEQSALPQPVALILKDQRRDANARDHSSDPERYIDAKLNAILNAVGICTRQMALKHCREIVELIPSDGNDDPRTAIDDLQVFGINPLSFRRRNYRPNKNLNIFECFRNFLGHTLIFVSA